MLLSMSPADGMFLLGKSHPMHVGGLALSISGTSTEAEIGCRRSVPRVGPMLGHLDDELGALEHTVGI